MNLLVLVVGTIANSYSSVAEKLSILGLLGTRYLITAEEKNAAFEEKEQREQDLADFKKIDLNGDGKLDGQELRFSDMLYDVDDGEFLSLVFRLDANSDAIVTSTEYLHFLMQEEESYSESS